ncbi:MAG: NB-ARC domain-containing protein, partial [Bacteroidota bacterium]
MTKKIKLFLASSNELKAEREHLKSKIATKNGTLHDKGIYLNLKIWEDESEMMSDTRSQDEYNKLVRAADIFICLAFTKVGKYTHEEFEQAYQQFKRTGQPKIVVYFKKENYPQGTSARDLLSLEDFQQKLSDLKYFPSEYKSADGLWNKINDEIDRYCDALATETKAGEEEKDQKTDLPKMLTAPPFQTDYFIGRADDLTAIHHKLFKGDHLLLLVNGKGGMGKTTIAARYFRQYAADYQHLAWIFTGESLLEALLTLAIPLQMRFEATLPNEERLERLLQAMSNLEKPCLLVIDNANEVQELERYYMALRRCPNFHLLLTTRITEFEGAVRHQVKPLESEDRLRLFQHHYKALRAEEHELLKSIIEAVGKNTLVIELLAKNLKQFNRLKTHYSLTKLWQDLQEKGLLGIKGKTVQTSYQAGIQLRRETPEAIIAAMYDLNDLSAAERQMLSIFAVLPAENILFATLADLLPSLEHLEDTLLQLAQSGWLEFNEAESAFKVSPVVQEIVLGKHENVLEDCNDLSNTISRKISEDEIIHTDTYEAALILLRYAESIIDSLDLVDDDLATLCQNIGNFYRKTGDLIQAMNAYQKMCSIQEQLLEQAPDNPDFKNGLAISYEKLGSTHTSLGNLDKALTFFEDETELFEALYASYPQNVGFKNGLAISYSKLGDTHTSLGNLDKALTFF